MFVQTLVQDKSIYKILSNKINVYQINEKRRQSMRLRLAAIFSPPYVATQPLSRVLRSARQQPIKLRTVSYSQPKKE